jgi:dihydrofolate reductase
MPAPQQDPSIVVHLTPDELPITFSVGAWRHAKRLLENLDDDIYPRCVPECARLDSSPPEAATLRKVILDTIISLDGFHTSLKNEIDWFEFDMQEIDWSKEILRRVDTMLCGRVTYEEFRTFWPSASPTPSGFDSEIIGQLNGLQKIVFSRTLTHTPWQPAVLVREDPAVAIARLKSESGRDMVVVGSGSLVSTLVQSGLVDEYRIRIRPIILGAGKPIFVDHDARHSLRLISAKTFDNGVVALHYEPVRR